MAQNARTKRKMQGQKGKCKDDIKSYSLDRFEQVERSKTTFQGFLYIFAAMKKLLQPTKLMQ